MRIVVLLGIVLVTSSTVAAEPSPKVKETKAIQLLRGVTGLTYIRDELDKSKPVVEVHARNTKFSDDQLKVLIYGFSHSLQFLNLEGTAITDEGIKLIAGPNLKRVNLACTDVSDAAVAAFAERLPNVKVEWQLTPDAQATVEKLLSKKGFVFKKNDREEIVEIVGDDGITETRPNQLWTEDDIRWIGGLTSVENLSLGYQAVLTKSNCKYLRHFKPLASLNLRCGERVDDDVVGFFCDTYPSIGSLHLSLCKQITSKSYEHIGKLKSLSRLELYNTPPTTKEGIEAIANLSITLLYLDKAADEATVVPVLVKMASKGTLKTLRIDFPYFNSYYRSLKEIQSLHLVRANGNNYEF